MELELQEQGPGAWAAATHTPSQSKHASVLWSCGGDEETGVKVGLICFAICWSCGHGWGWGSRFEVRGSSQGVGSGSG